MDYPKSAWTPRSQDQLEWMGGSGAVRRVGVESAGVGVGVGVEVVGWESCVAEAHCSEVGHGGGAGEVFYLILMLF